MGERRSTRLILRKDIFLLRLMGTICHFRSSLSAVFSTECCQLILSVLGRSHEEKTCVTLSCHHSKLILEKRPMTPVSICSLKQENENSLTAFVYHSQGWAPIRASYAFHASCLYLSASAVGSSALMIPRPTMITSEPCSKTICRGVLYC